MVAGHLQLKNGVYYTVINYIDPVTAKRKSLWRTTGLPERGNKRKAEAILMERRQSFTLPQVEKKPIYFVDFLRHWLETVRPNLAIPTYASYASSVCRIIIPYFEKENLLLADVTPMVLQQFYNAQHKRVSSTTVRSYHANLHSALKYAVKMELLDRNPADQVEKPKVQRFTPNFRSAEEVKEILTLFQSHKLYVPVCLGAFYGLRRSEALGLRWSAVDFSQNTITVNHTALEVYVDGARQLVARDRTKNKSSLRTLPLVPPVREALLQQKAYQEEMQALCGNCYCEQFLDYVCTDAMGDLLRANYITDTFQKMLVKNGFQKMRFHDLRHSCASVLLASGVAMKQIQDWLGHSDFNTTANIYAHLAHDAKAQTASAMMDSLGYSNQT